MIYLDTSAALKLAYPERESAALLEWLDARDDVLMSSRLLVVELHRALRRLGTEQDVRDTAAALLDGMYLRPLDPVVPAAAGLDGVHLRSLDALHLATAMQASPAPEFVTYDDRLATSATDCGLAVAAPAPEN